MHLGITLVSNQLDAQFFSVYVYFDTLRVSSNHVLIIRRINCINTTSGMSLCVGNSPVWMELVRLGWNAPTQPNQFHPYLHTRRSPTQSDICQKSH